MEKLVRRISTQASKSLRHARTHQFTTITLRKRQNVQRRLQSTDRQNEDQKIPLTGYWADILGATAEAVEGKKDILDEPLEKIQPATRTAPEASPAESLSKTDKEERIEKAQIVFGSRIPSPVERRDAIDAASQDVAGIMVPPKPEEPENCCMSGCVNCVWDVYRDDLEEWASKSAEAREQLQAQESSGKATGTMDQEPGMPSHIAVSVDDDGGASETTRESGVEIKGKEDDPLENIPVGIREFMRMEKMLKTKQPDKKASNP